MLLLSLQLTYSAITRADCLFFFYFLMVLYFADLFQILASAIFGGRPSFSNPNKTYKGIILGSIGALAIGSALFLDDSFQSLASPSDVFTDYRVGYLGRLGDVLR